MKIKGLQGAFKPEGNVQKLSKEEQERYARLEKEHLGDYEKQTGIYSRGAVTGRMQCAEEN